jgi:hypothetical protein
MGRISKARRYGDSDHIFSGILPTLPSYKQFEDCSSKTPPFHLTKVWESKLLEVHLTRIILI